MSPIVALYTIFTLGLLAAGPAFWWGFPITLAGQLLVASVFGELASRWPYEGSVYQWARHVAGTGAGWATSWAYMWGLAIGLSTLSYAAAAFLLRALGMNTPGKWVTVGAALAALAFGSLINITGRRVLKILIAVSLACEVLATVGLGTVLLLFYRTNPPSVLFEGMGSTHGGAWVTGPLPAAIAFVGWSFIGFESAGSIAEEMGGPVRAVPKALIWGLLSVGVIVMYSAAGLILAIPDLHAVMVSRATDPVSGTLVAHFGPAAARPMLVMLAIGFLASFLAGQTAVSRVLWASARDHMLPGSQLLGRLSGRERLPANAIALTGLAAAAFVLLSESSLYSMLVTAATSGSYIAYAIPVWGAALTHLRGDWRPGPISLGRASAPVTYAAALWLLAQTTNICWPRRTGQPWYLEWRMPITMTVVSAAGIALYTCWTRRRGGNLADPGHGGC